ncbi:MAG: glycosyltransferase family 39 protein [Gemmatales bacterium]|nr:glycosyltransferase family 39 protein [Gemmatales bacterium]
MNARLAVRSRQLISRRDWPYLVSALAIAVLIKTLIITGTVCIARDGVDYIQYAYYLKREPWPTVWRESSHHPLYPLAIVALHELLYSGQENNPESWQHAAQLVSLIASLFLTTALYLAARHLLGLRIAFGIAVLVNLLPGLTRCCADALSEALYLAAISWCLALAIYGIQNCNYLSLICSGCACGLAYWTRPEAAVLAASLVLSLSTSRFLTKRSEHCLRTAWAVTSFLVSFILIIAPYCYTIGQLTVKNSARHLLWQLSEVAPLSQGNLAWNTVSVVGFSYLESRQFLSLYKLLEETAQGFFYAPLLFVIPGIIFSLKKARARPGWLIVVLYIMLHFAVLWRGALVLGYVVERYTYPITLCGLLCAGLAWRYGVLLLTRRLDRAVGSSSWAFRNWPIGSRFGFVGFLALCTIKVLAQPLHQGAAGHREAGYWLQRHMKAEDNLFDPYGLAAFYSGQILLWTKAYPDGVGTTQGDWWIVLNREERDPRVRERIVAFSAVAEEVQPRLITKARFASEVVVYHLPGPVHKYSPLRGRYFPRVR